VCRSAACFAVRYDDEPSSALSGKVLVTAARLALTAAVSAAESNRYSICSPVCALAFWCRMSVWVGQTQASAVPVTENAKPTTVSSARLSPAVSVTVSPTLAIGPHWPRARTTWPVPVSQCPLSTDSRSTVPVWSFRPTTVIAPPMCMWPEDIVAETVANGPAAARTPEIWAVAASAVGSVTTGSNWAATCAPDWAANEWSNGASETASKPRPNTAVPVDSSATAVTTMLCSRRRRTPARIDPQTALIAILRPRPGRRAA
jgi:hypothetical protein